MDTTMEEERLLRLWSEVMQSGPVELDDDFIEFGGDSLVAMTLISRISGEFGVELDLWELLDAGTPRKVLDVIESNRSRRA